MFISSWFRWFGSLAHIIFPPHCTSCGILICTEHVLCSTCLKQIKPIASLLVQITETKSMVVYAASSYDDPLKKLILKKHYGDAHASHQLGQIIILTLNLDFLKPDIIIPVPLHWTRYARRGFNQAEVIAKVVGKNIKKPAYNLFKRRRKTQLQAELTVAQRIKNVTHAFAIKSRYQKKAKELLAGKTILLIDDLYTTGATIKSLARELLPYKPAKIMVLVACRVI